MELAAVPRRDAALAITASVGERRVGDAVYRVWFVPGLRERFIARHRVGYLEDVDWRTIVRPIVLKIPSARYVTARAER